MVVLHSSTRKYQKTRGHDFKESPADGEEFGYSVAIENSIALIGAKNSTLGTQLMAGTAYIYNIPIGSNGTAILTQHLEAPTPRLNASFGYSVALGDGHMVVGELNREGDGSVYLNCKNRTDGWEGALPPIKPEKKCTAESPISERQWQVTRMHSSYVCH
jgi:hypothetical protein